jgi:hypothetical protein
VTSRHQELRHRVLAASGQASDGADRLPLTKKRCRILANQRPEYNFVVRKYDIGKGYSVSVLWRGGEVDTIYGFETEHDALG